MDQFPNCPQCQSAYTYEDGAVFVCPECGNEWTAHEEKEAAEASIIRDSVGNPLAEGDTIIVAKDLNLKGAQSNLKVGTKVKNIRFVDVAGHDIEGKTDSHGVIYIKSIYVKKL
ncbi:zinc ribbon domain-containing protein YjdM [Kurthia sibirica]|uniref:Alkylphosphonate utilization protein n=1 Tax=Kurthia sibirica TaxID=202750 RepID=A0A2U3AII6_9BACL|nr:zinc ribbon domain-containing protein YjdM [Kurthia sibirica]PWI24366.1 hypothetical protein DEX24_13600 [Kurthia sibirica]GEK33783.1 hypothetical protein KSI01_13160 [Kurthia sibirica]